MYEISDAVNCGKHTARACELCPRTVDGNVIENWCNGDCKWHGSSQSCQEILV